MSKCVINLVTRNDRYKVGQDRLVTSLKKHFKGGEIFAYYGENTVSAPLHTDIPYGFKPYTFWKAFHDGYDQVLWLDASVVAVKDISPVFEEMASTGYIMQVIGHLLGRWVNDNCLKYYGLKREDVSNWPMYGDAGFLGLDFRSDVSCQFLREWTAACIGGAFNGSWDNHRHDMTCGSIIAHNLGMKMVEENKYLKYGFEDANKGEHTCLIGAGI